MALKLNFQWNNRLNASTSVAAELTLIDKVSLVSLGFTRATEGSVEDYQGVPRLVPDGVPRFQGGRYVYNYVDEAFSTYTTSESDSPTLAASELDPFNNTGTVYQFNEGSTGTGTHRIQEAFDNVGNRAPHTAGYIFCFSVFLKANDRDWAMLDTNTATDTGTYFDLVNGEMGIVSGAALDSGIIAFKNDWYRCWYAFEDDGSAATRAFQIFAAIANNDNTYVADGSVPMFMFGHQVEDVSGQDSYAPSEYVGFSTVSEVGTYKWYANRRRQNIATYSNDFSNAVWNKDNCTIVQDETDYNGVANRAWTLTDDATNDNHGVRRTNTLTDPLKIKTISIIAKAGTKRYMHLSHRNPAGNPSAWACAYDLELGATISKATQFDEFGIEPMGAGFYKCWASHNESAVSPQNIAFGPSDAASVSAGVVYVGDGTGTIIVCDAQVEYFEPGESPVAATEYIDNPAGVRNISDFDTAIHPDGLLVERAKTNIALQSEDLTAAGGGEWNTPVNAVIAADTDSAPNGTTTADSMTSSTVTGQSRSQISQDHTVATSTLYTYSHYLKADTGSGWASFRLVNFTTPGDSSVFFDLNTGVVGTTDAGFDDSGIEQVGSSAWYRCWGSFTTDAADTTGAIQITLADGDNDDTVEQDGSDSILLWGAQLEEGTLSSYIKTTAASETRNSDDVTGSYAFGLAGTLYSDTIRKFSPTANSFTVALNDGSAVERVSLYSQGNDNSTLLVTENSVTQAISATTDGFLPIGDQHRLVAGWGEDSAQLYTDGQAGAEDTSVVPPTLTEIDIGQALAGGHWDGTIAEIAFDDTLLSEEIREDWSNGIFPPGGAFGNTARRKAADAALWYHQMRLKQEDDEALKLIRKILG